MGMKTLLAFEWLEQNYEYDFVVRPTPSSYINHDNLVNFIKTIYLMIIHLRRKTATTNNKQRAYRFY